MIDHAQPANRGVLAYLTDETRLARSVSIVKDRPECLPAGVKDPYLSLGTHPDLVTRLWDELGAALPVDCRLIAFGMPALVRPDSGVIIGLAGGTQMYVLRLDAAGADEARAAGLAKVFRYPAVPNVRPDEIVIDAAAFGDTWVFGRWHPSEVAWLAAGYLAAG
jgi:hypothetical protein